MKRILFGVLVLAIAASLVISGCATPTTPSPTPGQPSPTATKPATSPTPTQPAGQVYTIRFSCQIPETGQWPQQVGIPFWKEVEKRSNGRIKVEQYYGQTLTKATDEWEAAKSGISDVGWAVHTYWPGMTPLGDVLQLPFLPMENGRHLTRVAQDIWNNYPNLQAEFKDNKIISFWTAGEYFVANRTRPVNTMADMKGLKLRITGATTGEALQAVGGVPQFLAQPDVYPNIQKGVIDGTLGCWECLLSFKQYQVTPYVTRIPGGSFYTAYFSLAMNKDKWNKMPKDLQDIIMAVWWGNGAIESAGKGWDECEQLVRDAAKKEGLKFEEITLTQDEFNKWKDIGGKPVWDKWVAQNEAAGKKDARNILNDVLSLLDKYRAEYKKK